MQCVDDGGYLQAWRPIPGCRCQQLFGRLAEIAGVSHRGDNLFRLDAGGCGDRAQGQLLGQPQVYSRKFRRNEPLAQITDRGQQLLRGLGQQRCQPFNQDQTTRSLLQVPIRLSDNLILHSAILAHSRAACPSTRLAAAN